MHNHLCMQGILANDHLFSDYIAYISFIRTPIVQSHCLVTYILTPQQLIESEGVIVTVRRADHF